jgi:hypothetical protein
MADVHLCGVEQTLFGVQCERPFGHDGPHEHKDDQGTTTWEPAYVGLLRKEAERLREALDDLAHAAREFSSHADYTVARAYEDEFIEALECAEGMINVTA